MIPSIPVIFSPSRTSFWYLVLKPHMPQAMMKFIYCPEIFGTESSSHLNIAACCQKYENNECNVHEDKGRVSVGWLWRARHFYRLLGIFKCTIHMLGFDILSCHMGHLHRQNRWELSTPLISLFNEAIELIAPFSGRKNQHKMFRFYA